ncbi:3-hexulose-6-phosphate synthase [Tenuibacillus multivorans]|uniref:3-hexulose-6-phosphate synthase n=1 Tax=Tenuibacillus multivorans TaxID=237069 RepID=A0A1H0C2B2_9BACI|nr:3-hexulose-6-phosphate synthase [Tenuibacillus multivorans]GEL77739.1 3-hexulose-6-phosphate synthase [Tenuibacillus multivorans]SDN52011.1 3-hexulose-6-phosphate synthase [Tenuibacillus multivorans]
MKLQLALDRLSREECMRLVQDTYESIDIIEIGTSVIKEYGMSIVREFNDQFPDKMIMADMKTCDAGGYETNQALDAGADIATVMAFSSNLTIQDCLKVGEDHGKHVMVDLLEVDSREKLEHLKEIGVEFVGLHVGKDKQQEGKFDVELFNLVDDLGLQVAVAGGINENTLPDIVQKKPDILIVGSAITKADQPKLVAKRMKEIINNA